MTPEAALEETPRVWTLPANGNGAKPTQVAQLQGAVFAVAWAPSNDIAFMGIDKPHTPWWANQELHVAGKGRLASGRDRTLTNSTYGDFQDRHVLRPAPWQII